MFRRLSDSSFELQDNVFFFFEGKEFAARKGDTVASALLASGVGVFRTTPGSSSPRAPYCMMGICFECLLEIDGVPNVQSCQAEVLDGMIIKSQRGARGLGCE